MQRIYQIRKVDQEALPLVREGVCRAESEILCEQDSCRIESEQRRANAAKNEADIKKFMMIFIVLLIWVVVFIYACSLHTITYGPEDLPLVRIEGIRVYRVE